MGGGHNHPGAHFRGEGEDVLDPAAKPGSSGADHARGKALEVGQERGEGGRGGEGSGAAGGTEVKARNQRPPQRKHIGGAGEGRLRTPTEPQW